MDDHTSPQPGTIRPGTLAAPVPTRARHDGWTPEKQHRFIEALAESGCVTEACAAVAMTPKSAYNLRARPDASIFRQAWDIALDHAIRRLSDAALSRAIHGVVRPVFYQGEQIGERRHYDERLTMFLLRYRDSSRYGAWRDDYEARRHPDGAGIVLAHALNALTDAAHDYSDEDDADPDRPLAEGPPPDPDAGLEEGFEQLAPNERDMARAIRAHLRQGQDGGDDDNLADPAAADMRDPLLALRSRKGKSDWDVP